MFRREHHHSFVFLLRTDNGIDFFFAVLLEHFLGLLWTIFGQFVLFPILRILVLLSFTFPIQTKLNFGLCSSSFLILSIVLNFPSILIFDIKGLDCSFPCAFFSNLSMV